MNQPLRIEPVTLETAPPDPRFDLVDSKTDEVIATIYDTDEDRAYFCALVFAEALNMLELLREIYWETAGKERALNYDQWLREVKEIVWRIIKGRS